MILKVFASCFLGLIFSTLPDPGCFIFILCIPVSLERTVSEAWAVIFGTELGHSFGSLLFFCNIEFDDIFSIVIKTAFMYVNSILCLLFQLVFVL